MNSGDEALARLGLVLRWQTLKPLENFQWHSFESEITLITMLIKFQEHEFQRDVPMS